MILSLAVCGAAAQASAPAPAALSLELDGDRLTLETRGTNLVGVLEVLGRRAGFSTVLVGDVGDRGPIELSLNKMPIEAALRRLLGDTEYFVFHAEDGRGIAQVWLLGPQQPEVDTQAAAGNAATTPDRSAPRDADRGRSVLRLASRADAERADPRLFARIRDRLIAILGNDADALVRTRAALALGKLGGDRAVDALAAATRDSNSAVGAQAIIALGGIESTRAIEVLGAVLTDAERPVRLRIIAAQALWRHDDADARGYLAIAAADDNERVRQAAREPPAAGPDRPGRNRSGSFELK